MVENPDVKRKEEVIEKLKKNGIEGGCCSNLCRDRWKTSFCSERWDPTKQLKFEPDVNRLFEPNGRASGCDFLRPVMCHKNSYVNGFRHQLFVLIVLGSITYSVVKKNAGLQWTGPSLTKSLTRQR